MTSQDRVPVNSKIRRAVHVPYVRVPGRVYTTPARAFDIRYVYRVLGLTGRSKSRRLVTLARTVGSVHDGTDYDAVLLFFVGAERDLDRFIYWCSSDTDGDDANLPIMVVEQPVDIALTSIEPLSETFGVKPVLVYPDMLDDIIPILSVEDEGQIYAI